MASWLSFVVLLIDPFEPEAPGEEISPGLELDNVFLLLRTRLVSTKLQSVTQYPLHG